MCEVNAYLLKDGEEELFLETVDKVEPEDGGLRLTSLYGEEKSIKARIARLSLLDHRLIIEKTED